MSKKENIYANIVFGALFLTLALYVIFIAIPTQINMAGRWSGDAGVNSRSFPYMASVVMGAAAAIQLIVNSIKLIVIKAKNREMPGIKIEWNKELRTIAAFILCVLYGLLFVNIGYIYATLIVPPIMLALLGSRKWQHYLSLYIVGAIMYVLFIYVLRIRLP